MSVISRKVCFVECTVLGFLAKDAFLWPQMLNFAVSSHYFNTGISYLSKAIN